MYDEVDWGVLVFFVGLFLIVGGDSECRNHRELSADLRALESTQSGGLHGCRVVAEQYCE